MASDAVTPPSESDDLHRLRYAAYSVAFPVEVAVGLFVNGAVLLVFGRSGLKVDQHVYAVWLAAANISVLCLAIPVLVVFSDPQCLSWPAAWYITYCALPLLDAAGVFSVALSLLMSTERFVSVCLPAHFRRVHRPPVVRAALLTSLLASVVVQTPRFFSRRIKPCDASVQDGAASLWLSEEHVELTSSPEWIAYRWVYAMLTVFVPCLLLVVLNVKTIVRFLDVIEQRSRMTATSTTSIDVAQRTSVLAVPPRAQPEEKQVVLLLSLILSVFAVCLIPVGVVDLVQRAELIDDADFRVWFTVAHCLHLFYFVSIYPLCCLCNQVLRTRLVLIVTCNW